MRRVLTAIAMLVSAAGCGEIIGANDYSYDGCGSPFTDPNGDGSLQLSGSDSFKLDEGTFSSVCMTGSAQIVTCSPQATLELTSGYSMIGGAGVTPAKGRDRLELTLRAASGASVVLYLDLSRVAATITLDAPEASIAIGSTGPNALTVVGTASDVFIGGSGDVAVDVAGSVVLDVGAVGSVTFLGARPAHAVDDAPAPLTPPPDCLMDPPPI